MFDPPLHVNAYGFIDDERADPDVISLQYDRWGFRINGGSLHSYPTKSEAQAAFYRLAFR